MTWWDMKPFPVVRLLQLTRGFEHIISHSLEFNQDANEPLAQQRRKILHEHFTQLVKECDECSLESSADQFARIAREVEAGASWNKTKSHFPDAMNRIEDECKRRTVFFIEPSHAKYFSDAQFFDSSDRSKPKVSTAFPPAAEDIAESGKCLACGRSTACVMHLGRVMEVGLKALASELTIGQQNDWGRYLKSIDDSLKDRFKTAGARSADEQFFAAAWDTFDAVRRAWRNPTMHVDKTYTVEHAEEILVAVRSFMRHLAVKLHS